MGFMGTLEMRYEIVEWDFITNSAFQKMHAAGRVDFVRSIQPWPCPNHKWSIKTFNDVWIFDNPALRGAKRVLDVGASISAMPATLQNHKGLEAWVIDKYDFSQQQLYIDNIGGVDRFRELTQGVKVVHAYLGEKHDLPKAYFDVIYSLSVLEHFPYGLMATAFREMDAALKPGGYLVHAVDIPIPCGVGESLTRKLTAKTGRAQQLRSLPLGGMLVDFISRNADFLTRHAGLTYRAQMAAHKLRGSIASTEKPYLLTSEGWGKFIRRHLGIANPEHFARTTLARSAFDRDVFIEPVEQIFHRWPPLNTAKPYWPTTSINFVLRKV
jgi:SAM-dependent methyltransferase